MAEVSQTLVFDASQALRELDKLDTELKQLNTTLASVGGRGFKTFNQGAGRTVAALKQVSIAAAAARRALAGSATIGDFNVNKGVDSFTALGQSASKSAESVKKVGSAAKTTGNQAESAGKKGTKAAQSMTISFQTLARVIVTQLIVRAFGALQRTLSDSVRQALEFQNTVAEIATIDIRGGGGFGAIADDVEKLSNAFGVDLGDVGRGLYQTISNQIAQTGTAAERAAGQYEFLSDAIKFSVAGVTSVESSVNLLSGTINAFGEDASSAGRIAAQFFKTIELGRTTASELANSFGTVAPVAAQLGVSIEELQASFATITIGGLDTAKAATQIRGALTSLLKPTKAMKTAFEQLGVANGEQLIDLFGFQGGLEAVIGTTDGTAGAIAQLIPRIRGLGGALRLASEEGAEAFRTNLRAIIRANEELLDQKFEIVFTTEARQLENDLNRLSNLFTRDFGEKAIEAINKVIAAFGGFDNVLQVFESFLTTLTTVGPVLLPIAVGIGAIGIASQLASAKVGLLGKSLGILAAAGAAVALGDFIGTQIRDALEADNKAIEEAFKQRLEFNEKQSKLRIEIEEATNKEIFIEFNRALGELAAANAGRIRDAQRTGEKVREANADAFSAILSASQALESKLKGQFKAREGQAKTAIDNIKGFERDLSDARFEASTRGISDSRRFFVLQQKLASENAAAREALARATRTGDPEAIEEARQAFARVSDTVKELSGLAPGLDKALGRSLFQFKADQANQTLLRSRIDGEEQLLRVIKSRQVLEKKAAEEASENNRKLKGILVELIEAQDAVFEKGIAPKEQKRRVAEFSKLRTEFLGLIKANEAIGAEQVAGFAPFLAKGPEQILTDAQIDRVIFSESALQNARTQLTEAFEGSVVELEIAVALRAAGVEGELSVTRVGELVKDIVKSDEIINRIEEEIRLINESTQAAVAKLKPLRQQILDNLGGDTIVGIETTFTEPKRALDSLIVQLSAAIKDGFISDSDQAIIKERTEAFGNAFKELSGVDKFAFQIQFEGDASVLKNLQTAFAVVAENADKATEAQKRLNTATGEARIPDASVRENVIKAVEFTGKQATKQREATAAAAETAQKVSAVGTAANTAATQLGAIPQAIDQGTLAVANLQTALNNLTVPDLSVNVGTVNAATGGRVARLAKGGMAYLADGGFTPQGTDTIPAMLSEGEFVVNARSTRRFFSQLQAMNAGVKPIFRQEGGPVTNVGDINVSVTGSKDNVATGHLIARSLRRELRRDNSSF